MNDTSPALARERWGLRFTDPAVEADYRRWRVASALPFTRIGMIAGLVAWTGVLAAFYLGIPEGFARAAGWILLVMIPLHLAAIAATYAAALQRPRARVARAWPLRPTR